MRLRPLASPQNPMPTFPSSPCDASMGKEDQRRTDIVERIQGDVSRRDPGAVCAADLCLHDHRVVGGTGSEIGLARNGLSLRATNARSLRMSLFCPRAQTPRIARPRGPPSMGPLSIDLTTRFPCGSSAAYDGRHNRRATNARNRFGHNRSCWRPTPAKCSPADSKR